MTFQTATRDKIESDKDRHQIHHSTRTKNAMLLSVDQNGDFIAFHFHYTALNGKF